jgi:hypothetical protein
MKRAYSNGKYAHLNYQIGMPYLSNPYKMFSTSWWSFEAGWDSVTVESFFE